MYVKNLNIKNYALALFRYVQLRNNLKRPVEQIRAEQFVKLKALVDFAWREVPLYRRHFEDGGFHPSDLKSLEDIKKIPIISRELFQESEHLDHLADCYDIRQLVKGRTSGSSGSPLDVYYTKEDWIYRTLLDFRAMFYNGMGLRDKMVQFCDVRHTSDFRYIFQKLGFLSKTFVFIGEDVDLQLKRLSDLKPGVIYSYASNIVLLAKAIKERGIADIKPKLIFTTAELLSQEDRKVIKEAFSVAPQDLYAAVEMGCIAWQCPCQEGYHVNIDSFLLEVEGEGLSGNEKLGKVVITNLHSFAMPFIRYQLDDVITIPEEGVCPCGCTFPRIKVLNGRSDDWIYTADGRGISPLVFIIASIPGVKQYRIIQKAHDTIMVEILPGRDYGEQTLNQVRDHVVDILGPKQTIEVRLVGEIPKQAGKMRRVISEISDKIREGK
jgi:phenylacetate-CoA ligase